MTSCFDKYQAILDKPETPEFNDIDRARVLLETLLDDEDVNICWESGAVIEHAITLLT